ncbi:interleukin-18 receptor accessory protein-like isoform X3 [Acipenser oxyrinchus oxyrinchus]|uniref:Interleukin-18 receptor accessory protein-like isoform X3 n=1 Tax=Acipenser oxyrinchus oxyrinchus TaxID=40147 RepID=A0AAD8DDY5_ACIOX|nr:interleukin-18 receptor accessory protein-like isoform X3 [Acipenser oxyrinchus oxyrinchus]
MWTGVYWALPVILLLLPGVQVTFYTFQETEGFLTGMQPSGYIALAGDQFIMQCASLNQSVIYNDSESYQNKVAWFRHYQNGGQAQPVGNGQENIILKGNFLWFPKLETVHSGVYSCQIRDEKIYLTLAVIQKDKTHCQDYAHSTVDLLSGSGDSITCPAMTCYSASGHLPVRWYKNGKLVKLNKNRPTLELENEKLVLKTVYKRDAANYTCDFNYSENDTLWIVRRMLTVRVFGKETKIPPSILNFNGVETIEAELGKPLTLECRVNFGFERNSTPTIKWLVNSNDNSTDISLELEESRIVEDDGNGKTIIHTAYFSKVTERHLIATFTCFAQNFQGNTTGVLRLKKKSPVNGPFLTYVLCGIILTVIFIFGGSAYIYIHWIEIVLLYRNYFPYDETIGDGKEYDAFISHANHSSSEDILESEEGGGVTEEMFVLKLLPEFLEQQCGYKLCFLERDVLPGGAYTEDIVASIKRSRRVIYVLSPRYISSPCIFELQTGINQLLVDDQFKLILIKFRPLPEMDTLPHIVKKALNILPAMKWNGSKSNHSDSTFWKNVRYHMPVKKTKISNGDPGL